MVHLQDAERGDGLQIWRIAPTILNVQSQTANKGVGHEPSNSQQKKKRSLFQNVAKGLREILQINNLPYEEQT
jgi:hypothetical protein